jgi:hypothetical protein
MAACEWAPCGAPSPLLELCEALLERGHTVVERIDFASFFAASCRRLPVASASGDDTTQRGQPPEHIFAGVGVCEITSLS